MWQESKPWQAVASHMYHNTMGQLYRGEQQWEDVLTTLSLHCHARVLQKQLVHLVSHSNRVTREERGTHAVHMTHGPYRGLQIFKIARVHREDTGEHHWLGGLETGQSSHLRGNTTTETKPVRTGG